MEYYLFIILMFFVIKPGAFAQKLTFFDLEYALTHELEDVDTYLGKKGYEFLKYEEEDKDSHCASTDWAFNRNVHNDRANSFVTKLCDESNKGLIWYQPTNKQVFEELKSQCKELGFEYVDKKHKIEIGAICFVYVNKKYRIEFTSGIDGDNRNVYSITLETRDASDNQAQ